MSKATVTSKGQITIPIEIRHLLNLHPGDQIEFFIENHQRVVIHPKTLPIESLKGFLKKPRAKRVSFKQMNQAIRKRASKKIEI